MTPRALMQRRRAPLRLVIFDCDGVLVDSEPVANRIIAEELTRYGWTMTTSEATRRFLGVSLADLRPIVAARLGGALAAEVAGTLPARIVAALAAEAAAIPGAVAALHAATRLGIAWRIASNSSHAEMAAKFRRLGLCELVRGRLHSFTDVAQGKPAPDLFLAAAAAEGVTAADCLVVEDSPPGVRGAVAAGMDCLGFAPEGDGAALSTAGAVPFHAMTELPGLLAAARRRAA